MIESSGATRPNTRLKLTAPVNYGRIAFVNGLAWRRSLSAIRSMRAIV